jgi:hypothetical protein
MFIGHSALAFGAKRAARRASLGVLVAAAQLCDLIWPILVHRPDLALYPGGAARVGLGLWYSVAGTVVVAPSSKAVGWFALSGWLVPFWAAWIDRHRLPAADR